jgi:TfoX/Sxy family transcriptional regulator of competence genes
MAYDEVLADRLRDLLESVEGVTERKMFGGLAFLVHGHMAVTASGRGGLLLRVDPADSALLDDPHAEPFVMHGRELDGWLHIDAAGVTTDAELARWAGLGIAYARSLPPKA